jgi:hypothetical protein
MDVQVTSEKELRQLQSENSKELISKERELRQLQSENSSKLLQNLDSRSKQLSSLLSSMKSEREEMKLQRESQAKRLNSIILSLRSEGSEIKVEGDLDLSVLAKRWTTAMGTRLDPRNRSRFLQRKSSDSLVLEKVTPRRLTIHG